MVWGDMGHHECQVAGAGWLCELPNSLLVFGVVRWLIGVKVFGW